MPSPRQGNRGSNEPDGIELDETAERRDSNTSLHENRNSQSSNSQSATRFPQPANTRSSQPTRDVEQGDDGVNVDTSVSANGPTLTIIDINPDGTRELPVRYGDDPEVVANQQPDDLIRIICNEVLMIDDHAHTLLVNKGFLDRPVLPRPAWTEWKSTHFSDLVYPLVKVTVDKIIKAYWNDKARRRFNIRHLQALLKRPKGEERNTFVLQSNLSRSSFPVDLKPPGPKDGGFLLISEPQRVHNGYLRLSSQYWNAFIEVAIDWNESHTSVSCTFPQPQLLEPAGRAGQERVISSLQSTFEGILESSDSALEFCGSDKVLMLKLILLDLLRSSMVSWADFFSDFGNWLRVPLSAFGRTLRDFEEDVSAHENFSATVRDLGACLEFLLQSIEDIFDRDEVGENIGRRRKWRHFVHEVKSLHRALQNTADDLLKRADRDLSFFVANINQKQAESSKILTIVASVFLPLTLSSSLLAMTVPASTIGDLWYDWIGRWLTIGFTVIMALFLARLVRKFFSFYWIKFVTRAINLLASWMKRSLVVIAFLLSMVIIASFIVGMFKTKDIAIDILKYGIAAVFAIVVLRILTRLTWIGSKAILRLSRFVIVVLFAFYQLRRLGGKFVYMYTLFSPDDDFHLSEEELIEARRLALKAWASNAIARNWVYNHREGFLLYIISGEKDRTARLTNIRQIASSDSDIGNMLGDLEIFDTIQKFIPDD